MATCLNVNLPEYKALKDVYKTDVDTANVVNNWQKLNNVETFPTVLEAQNFVSNQKLAFSLRQRQFSDALLNNLRRERIGHSYQGSFYVNNSNPTTREYDEMYLASNLKRLKRYLQINNIPENRVTLERTAKTYRVTVNQDMFSAQDMIESSRSWDTPRARAVVMHLKRMFPQINVQMLSVSQARQMYEGFPEWKKNNVPFDQMRSFYVDGVAYLIKGRVTDEVAIEEMLHPFVDAIKIDNEGLFNSLLAEARSNFPEMVQEIEDSYNEERSFNDIERDLEIVTQALSRHFNKEYENQPTKRFLDRVKEVLEWFRNIINNLNEYLTGRAIPVSEINANTSMSDIAKLLNTEGIQFKLESRVNGKVRYSLSPEKKKVVDAALAEANGLQAEIIDRLFFQARASEQEIDSLSANLNDTSSGTIVTLNEENHTYVDITNGEIYTSVTTAIKGELKNQEDVQLNLDIGNDVDALLDAIVTHRKLEDIIPEMKILSEETAKETYNNLSTTLANIMPEGSVALSQVVVFDEATKLAGTADLVIIDKNGKIKIVDLKTTKNSLKTLSYTDTISGRRQSKLYDKKWDLSEDSLLKQAGVDALSTRGQHNLQVNLYRRMFENMGYTVYEGDYAASTIHFLAGITGKGKDQKFDGNIKADQWVDHPASQNAFYVDKLVPRITDNVESEKLESAIENAEDAIYKGEKEFQEDEFVADSIDPNEYPEYNTILGALENYRIGLLDRKKALEQIKSSIFMDRTKEQTQENIASTLAYIGIAISEGPISRSQAYSSLLRDALKQVKSFSEYIEDPKNFGKSEYITYALNFDRFIKTFEGLYAIADSKELNATQRSLVLSLQLELNKLSGGSTNQPGLIDTAIDNYVKEIIKTRSGRDFGGEGSVFTMEDLDELMKIAPDINGTEYMTRDMATSPDVILALMDKIYKAKKQELLDRIGDREALIRAAGAKLLKLSSESDVEKLYDFMLERDSEGNFTGFYTQKIGQQYYNLQQELRNELYDNDGHPYEYRDIKNLDEASEEDIKYNKALAEKKSRLSEFFRAETKDENGDLADGEYHRYTDEFKAERDKFEFWVPGSEASPNGTWYRKPRISDRDYAIYEAKYYDFIGYTKAVRVNGQPTGAIVKDQTFRSPKPIYREAREITSKGQDMRNAKYVEIMSPTDALGQAKKEFYELFIDLYENDLLNKLPVGVRTQMLGRVPLVKNNVIDDLKGKPNLVTKLYAKTIGSNAWNMFKQTSQQKGVVTDENGNMISTLPIFYTGRPKVDGEMEVVEKEISNLQAEYKKGRIVKDKYDKELAILNGKLSRLRATPSLGQISTDMTTSLLKFSAMAQNYETMGTVEDTLNAMIKVLENREYTPADTSIETGKWLDGQFKKIGKKKGEGVEPNVVRRAKKFMSMVYYDNELVSKGFFDKLADGLIQLSSLSYVAFNPFGNFNNYVIGRINNNIELLGGRFFGKAAFMRASLEFNKRALPDLIKRTSYNTTDLADIATLGVIPGLNKSDYDPKKPNSKYEAFVDLFRMMDKMSDIREQSASTTGEQSWFARAAEWGYVLQDSAEYNVQTKVGMALLMDTTIKNSTTGETLALYDAFDYDAKTHKNVLKEGYDTIVRKNGTEVEYTDEFRYELRNQIREVNKQIHGNYAREDRMVMQSTTIGNLAAQFHKWVAPAIRARYQREYFDENLGWMEGRYISFLKFLSYMKNEVSKGNLQMSSYGKGFLKEYGFTGEGGNRDQRAKNKLFGFYRTMGEIGIMSSVFLLSQILNSILAGEDDDDEVTKRFKNMAKYQADRTYKELIMFTPLPPGLQQQFQMLKSPIASTRTLGEIGEALSLTVMTPLAYMVQSEKDFYANSEYVYQNKPRKGELKVYKNWKDAVPILYTIQKWDAYLNMEDFFIK